MQAQFEILGATHCQPHGRPSDFQISGRVRYKKRRMLIKREVETEHETAESDPKNKTGKKDDQHIRHARSRRLTIARPRYRQSAAFEFDAIGLLQNQRGTTF